MRRSIRALLAISSALLLSACQRHDTIWIGASGQFGGAQSGRDNANGIILAVEQFNAAGGANGRLVTLVMQNDSGRGPAAARAARALSADHRISAVIGHTTSAAMIAAAPIYDGRIAAVATTASAPALSGISSWVFRVIPSDSVTGAQLARFAVAHGWHSAGILYQSDVYGRGLADAFRRGFSGRVISSDPVADAPTDLSAYGRFYQRFTPDVVLVVTGRGALPIAVKREMSSRGVHAAILASEGSTDLVGNTMSGDEIFVGAPFSGMETRPRAREFIDDFTRRWGHAPNHNAALAYDASLVVFHALKSVGSDRAAIRRFLAGIDSAHAVSGVTGNLYFDALGDRLAAQSVILQVRNGQMAAVATTP